MPTSGARRLRSTSIASALSGDTYKTRHRSRGGGTGLNIRRFRHDRNAASVLPDPVGARMSVDSPRTIAGHPARCASVAPAKTDWNHRRTGGSNRFSGSRDGGTSRYYSPPLCRGTIEREEVAIRSQRGRRCFSKNDQISSVASNAVVGLAAPVRPGLPPGHAWALPVTL